MRFGLCLAVVAVMEGLVPAARAQRVGSGAGVGIADSLATRIDAIFADVDRTASPGCALGVVRDGALIYERGYGMANLDDGVPLGPTSAFYIASTSKQFTATSILLLAERGRLSLDDDVRRWIPELPDYGERITVRNPLVVTSNSPTYGRVNFPHPLGRRDWAKLVRRASFRRARGGFPQAPALSLEFE
jgi:CubicO group peptidase (beta-lactamase class C family)